MASCCGKWKKKGKYCKNCPLNKGKDEKADKKDDKKDGKKKKEKKKKKKKNK